MSPISSVGRRANWICAQVFELAVERKKKRWVVQRPYELFAELHSHLKRRHADAVKRAGLRLPNGYESRC